MAAPDVTCWTLIRRAVAGGAEDRDAFARRYLPVVRAYLGARWRGTALLGELDDAAQEVFVDFLRPGGALERAEADRPGGFRAFLYGVVRIVALRYEERAGRSRERQASASFDADALARNERSLSEAFDHAWALSFVRQARRHMEERASSGDATAARRLDLLRLRFEEALPIREIAARWEVDPAFLHREYRRARRDFHRDLLAVVAFHHPGPAHDVEAEASRLLRFFL